MSVTDDPALYKSNFERRERDRYFTEPWVTRALIRNLPARIHQGLVWEPAVGRGDMAREIQDAGYTVTASDIDLSEFPRDLDLDLEVLDFLTDDPPFSWLEDVSAVLTNPPYDKAEEFIRRSLDLGVGYVAMLLRSEFNHASSRVDLFRNKPFAREIVLTSRPRWDWWLPSEELDLRKLNGQYAGPRHNFSWFIWDRGQEGPSTQVWEGKHA